MFCSSGAVGYQSPEYFCGNPTGFLSLYIIRSFTWLRLLIRRFGVAEMNCETCQLKELVRSKFHHFLLFFSFSFFSFMELLVWFLCLLFFFFFAVLLCFGSQELEPREIKDVLRCESSLPLLYLLTFLKECPFVSICSPMKSLFWVELFVDSNISVMLRISNHSWDVEYVASEHFFLFA